MPLRVFTAREREALRVKMLDAGFDLIRQYGMTHASVERITQAAGLGKSTFYNFFASKERFVTELIRYQREQSLRHFSEALQGRERMTSAEGQAYLKTIVFSQNSIYQYLTSEDLEKLKAVTDLEYISPDDPVYEKRERETMDALFGHMEGVRADMDFHVVANLIKMMAIAKMNRDQLHVDALDRTLEHIYGLLFSLIFQEDA